MLDTCQRHTGGCGLPPAHEFANVAEHVKAEHPGESLEEDPE